VVPIVFGKKLPLAAPLNQIVEDGRRRPHQTTQSANLALRTGPHSCHLSAPSGRLVVGRHKRPRRRWRNWRRERLQVVRGIALGLRRLLLLGTVAGSLSLELGDAAVKRLLRLSWLPAPGFADAVRTSAHRANAPRVTLRDTTLDAVDLGLDFWQGGGGFFAAAVMAPRLFLARSSSWGAQGAHCGERLDSFVALVSLQPKTHERLTVRVVTRSNQGQKNCTDFTQVALLLRSVTWQRSLDALREVDSANGDD
jgi:hypothetical protein